MPAKKKTSKKTTKAKFLFRSKENNVIGGVAGGVGEYFDIDPTIIRILFILLTVFGGGGLFIYLILWLVIPSGSGNKMPSEESIKESANEIKEKAEGLAQEMSVKKSGQFWWGVLILGLGLIFLLNNFGIFPWRMWGYVWRLWPIFLIIFGLNMLSKKS